MTFILLLWKLWILIQTYDMHPPYFGILDKWIHTLPTNSLIFNPSSVYINIIHYITYIVRHCITKCGCETWSYIYYYLLWVGDINIYITYYLYCKKLYHCISSLLTLGWGRGIRRVGWGPRRGCHTVSWRTVPSWSLPVVL